MLATGSSRDQNILKKYMDANVIRKSKEQIRKQIHENSAINQVFLKKSTEFLNDLENRALSAYKIRERERYYKQLHQKSVELRNSYMLHKKILRITHSQDRKLIRKAKSTRPKINPLPYLRDIREKLQKSIEIEEATDLYSLELEKASTLMKNLSLQIKPKSKIKILMDYQEKVMKK